MLFDRRRYVLYWATQLAAWTLYCAVFGFLDWLKGVYVPGKGWVLLHILVIGIVFSHSLRTVIVRKEWLGRLLGGALPHLILAAVLLGSLAGLMQAALHDLVFRSSASILRGGPGGLLEMMLNWTILLAVWGVMYFAFHWFTRSRHEEIRNLRLQAANRDGQLANLRAQLNPHFMFNALNGIRALIDEDPDRAKKAITQLSAILRNAMTTVKRRTVPLGEEMDIVKNYLALEQMRFEERLRATFDVDPALEREPVPPMLLQTLVENAVKHGIAKLTQGGDVRIAAQRGLNGLVLSVSNSGHYTPGEVAGSGIGLENTRKRLAMIYGPDARLHIENRDGMVVTEVELPAPTPAERIA